MELFTSRGVQKIYTIDYEPMEAFLIAEPEII